MVSTLLLRDNVGPTENLLANSTTCAADQMRPKASNMQGHSLDVSDAKDALSGNEYQLGVVPEIELIPSRHPGKHTNAQSHDMKHVAVGQGFFYSTALRLHVTP